MHSTITEHKNTVIDEEFYSRQEELEKTVEVKENEALPFQRGSSLPQLFPFDALGPILGPPAKRMHEVVKAPDSICGNSILAVAALITHAHADIHIDGRIHPLSLFILTVAESGDRKSAVEKIALKPVKSFEKMMFKGYGKQKQIYKNQKERFTLQEIYQKGGPRKIRKVSVAKRILGILESHNRIKPDSQPNIWRIIN